MAVWGKSGGFCGALLGVCSIMTEEKLFSAKEIWSGDGGVLRKSSKACLFQAYKEGDFWR